MRTPGRARRAAGAVAVLLTCAAVTSCSIRPEDLPSVRGGIGSSYPIAIEFDSVMNLPSGADVILDGVRVGEVRGYSVSDDRVTVDAGIRTDTRIPTDIHAIVRQNTLLGDTYVALVRNDPSARSTSTGFLPEGGTVPVERTVSPPQLEDTMAVLATFVNGGTIQRIQDVMASVNTIMPAGPEITRLASVVSEDLHDLGGRTAEIDRTLQGLNSTAVAFDANADSLATVFDADTVHYWRRLAISVVSHIGQILPSVGSLYAGGLWLVPMFESMAEAAESTTGGPTNASQFANFLTTTVVPFANNPSVDVVSVETTDGDQVLGDVQNILRMLGAVQ